MKNLKTTEKLIETVERFVDSLYHPLQIPDYIVETFDEETEATYIYRYNFTEEEIDQIMSLKEKYGVPGFEEHLIDIFKDEDILYDIARGDKIVDIRYQDKQEEANIHPIRFSRYEYDGSELRCYPFTIYMPKQYYARLIRHSVVHPGLSFNLLEKIDPGLFQWLHREVWKEIEEGYREGHVPPFLIVMDQAQSDALELAKTL